MRRLLRSVVALAAVANASIGMADGGSSVDLTMTALTGAPATIASGKSFSLTSTVSTTGAVTRSFSVSFYLSSDATITTADRVIGSRTVASLARNASSTATTTVTVPANVAPGNYYVGAIADSSNVVAESNEGNNAIRGSVVQVTGAVVDLTMTSLNGKPGTIGAGDTFTVSDTVTASPTGAATGTFSVGYYLSTTSTVTTSGIFLMSRTVSGLAPGQSSTSATAITIPVGTSPGTYYFGAIADSSGVVPESNESNNVLVAGPIVIGAFSCQHPATPVDDGNPCTVDACDPVVGVTHTPTPLGSSCSDGNACNGVETCDGSGRCLADIPPQIDDGNPCTVDACDPATGVSHTPAAAGTSCSDGNVCNGAEVCNGSGVCTGGAPLVVDDGNACTADSCDPVLGVRHTVIAGCTVVPPDPATLATPNDPTVATDFTSSTAFLYSGSGAIQAGVAPGTLEARRVAVIRGAARERDGTPIAGASIGVLDHPEFGVTYTRADGLFDMAVNGGGALTLMYQKDGYLPSQRQVSTPWRDYVHADDVVLVPLDAAVTSIAIGAGAPQVARGTAVADAAGARQATVVFPSGTQASMVLPDGTAQPLATMHVRATEYTVGGGGREAMPATLPPASGYTYAVELSVDEALTAGARSVTFSRPVPLYVENFLGFPVGEPVPTGYYDRQRAAWIPLDNGRVIKLLGVTGGLADVDTIGSGLPGGDAAYAALGLTVEERAQLASLYSAGTSLWRVPLTHFSPVDCNWPYTCDGSGDCEPPKTPPPDYDDPIDDPEHECGSIIDCENQGLGERVPVAGTSYSLAYQSLLRTGRHFTLAVTGPSGPPAGVLGATVKIEVAGRAFSQYFPGPLGPDVTYDFQWDGLDAYGRPHIGSAVAHVHVGYHYRQVYLQPGSSARTFGMLSASRIVSVVRDASVPAISWKDIEVPLRGGSPDDELGGWALDVHHSYDPESRTVTFGSGATAHEGAIGAVLSTISSDPSLFCMNQVTTAPDGTVYAVVGDYAAQWCNTRMVRVGPDGEATYIAGTGSLGTSPDGLPATKASISATHPIVGPDGLLYFGDNYRIRRIESDGTLTTVAGNGTSGSSPDGVPATSVPIGFVDGLGFGPDGSLYFIDYSSDRIRRVDRAGILSTVAGSGTCRMTGADDGLPALSANLCPMSGLAVASDGAVVFIDDYRGVRRVGVDGSVRTVIAYGYPDSPDGTPAASAVMELPSGIAIKRDGTIFLYAGYDVRAIDSFGILTTPLGRPGVYATTAAPDGALALGTVVQVRGIAVAPDGTLLVSHFEQGGYVRGLLRRVAPLLPGGTVDQLVLPSKDASQIYVFAGGGKHLQTLDARTGGILFEFAYDAHGRLEAVSDGDGNASRIERDTDGRPVAIVAPRGQTTTFALDENGFSRAITNPAGETVSTTFNRSGGMLSLTDPRGGLHSFSYDPVGRLVRDESPAGSVKSLSRVGQHADYAVTVSTALGRATTHAVQNLASGERRRTTTRPDGTVTVEVLDTSGTRTVTDASGVSAVTSVAPDPRFGLAAPMLSGSLTTPGGRSRTFARTRSVTLADPNNPLTLQSLTETLVVNGRSWTTSYDAATRTLTASSAAGRVTVARVDAQGRLAAVRPPGVAEIVIARDAAGQVRSISQGARTSTVDYDAAGLPYRLTDPLGRVSLLAYDAAGRVLSESLPGSRTVGFAYDANGNLRTLTPPGSAAHAFASDAADRLATYTPPDAPNTGVGATTYLYDLDSALAHVLLPDGTSVVPTYDAAGRLASVATARGTSVVDYDAASRVRSLSTPEGGGLLFGYDGFLVVSEQSTGAVPGVVSRTFDGDFRLSGVSVDGTSIASFQYDADSLLTQAGALAIGRDPATSRVSGTSAGVVATTSGYGDDGALASTSASASGAAVYAYQLGRDVSGRIVGKTETVQGATSTYTYGYDDAGRLTSVTRGGALVESYWYDQNGNRLSATSSGGTAAGAYDAQDRMTTYGAATYTYGANGDLRTRTAGGQTTTYSYDSLGNLMGVWLPDGRVIEYVVDGLNRRVGKKVNGVLAEGFLYDGQLRPIAWLDGAGAVKATFVYGLHVNVPEYMTTSAGTFRFVHDHLGSPRLVVDTGSGAVVQRMDYDSFGNVLGDSAPGFQPFGFAGGLYDLDTGLVRFGARDYDPQVGRWTNKDATRFMGGWNLYGYCYGDPVNFIDPRGTNPLAGAIGGAEVGSVLGPVGAAVGAIAGAAGGAYLAHWVWDYFTKPPTPNPQPSPPGGGGGACPANPRPWPGWDPTAAPGPDFGWRGQPPVGGGEGSWHDPTTGESLHPDLNHAPPIGPHWDWRDPNGDDWRIFPDGSIKPK